MKIKQLISGNLIPLSNEEKDFVNQHKSITNLRGLNEHELWIAQNLVRKGIYDLSEDGTAIIKQIK